MIHSNKELDCKKKHSENIKNFRHHILKYKRNRNMPKHMSAVCTPPFISKFLGSRVLYYPMAGNDTHVALSLFAPFINEFWFVDIEYFKNVPADLTEPLVNETGWNLLDVNIQGSSTYKRERRVAHNYPYTWIEPCTRTERYMFGGEIVTIHRRRGFAYQSLFGPSTVPTNIPDLGIFFYRGDSRGDGGSNQMWMSNKKSAVGAPSTVRLLPKVIEKLASNALIVTDGSNNHAVKGIYSHFSAYRENQENPMTSVQGTKPFQDEFGNNFECIGYINDRSWWPTFIWSVRKQS